MIVALQPSKSDPLKPGGQVNGGQHDPSDIHTSPLGQVRQVMFGSPQPAAIGWQEGFAIPAHVFGVQQLPSKQVSLLVQAVPLHVSVFPEQGSL